MRFVETEHKSSVIVIKLWDKAEHCLSKNAQERPLPIINYLLNRTNGFRSVVISWTWDLLWIASSFLMKENALSQNVSLQKRCIHFLTHPNPRSTANQQKNIRHYVPKHNNSRVIMIQKRRNSSSIISNTAVFISTKLRRYVKVTTNYLNFYGVLVKESNN